MGMSSSQARLLSLTARQHDVELRAQKLQADKLQMANNSDQVYNKYMNALSATKIQTKVWDKWEGDTFKDATLAMLENGAIPNYTGGEVASTPLFLQEISTGRLMITPEYATYIGVTADTQGVGNQSLDDYLRAQGLTQTKEISRKYNLIPDPDINNHKMTSFTGAIANSNFTQYQSWYSGFTPVENDNNGGLDISELTPYASFDGTHKTISGTAISGVTSFESGKTYTISTAADLEKLRALSETGQSTSGATFILTDNIDMKDYNWAGITNFQGTFDGNGYTINNLTGTQGLFATVSAATIKNVGVNISNTGINGTSNVGGLIGSMNGASSVENCYVSGGDVSGTGDNIGGLIGYTSKDTTSITNVYTTVNVSGDSNVGGLIGYYGASPGYRGTFDGAFSTGDVTGTTNVGGLFGTAYFDPDVKDWSYNTTINNVYTGGTITGNSAVGGLVGDMFYWADYGDHLYFNNCDTAAIINGNDAKTGIFFGYLHEKTNDTGNWHADNGYPLDTSLHFNDSSYSVNGNPTLGSNGSNPILAGEMENADTDLNGANEDVQAFTVAAKIPSINANADGTGSYYSNIMGVLLKSGLYNPAEMTETEKTQMDNNIKSFLGLFSDNKEDNTKLYYLNEKICEYLNAENPSAAQEQIAHTLYQDVINRTTNNTQPYQTGADIGTIKRSTEDLSWHENIQMNETPGTLTIPHLNVIKKELTYALMIGDSSLTEEAASNMAHTFLDKYRDVNNTTDDNARNTDRAYLANVNEILYNFSQTNNMSGDITLLLTKVMNGGKWTKMPKEIDDISKYEISINGTDGSNLITPQKTANMIEDKDNPIIEYDWDWEDPAVKNAVDKYNLLKTGFVIIGDATKSADFDAVNMHQNSNWLTNVLNCGIAQFVKYDYEAFKKAQDSGVAADKIDLAFYGTSIANETSVQEVADTEYVKRAEAEYEAAMRKINRKETKIDTELSQLEAERTSIKTEQDGLKKIIQENIDLNFKLFS